MKKLFIILFLILNVNVYSQENRIDSLKIRTIPAPKITNVCYPYAKLRVQETYETYNTKDIDQDYPEPDEFIPVEKNPSIDLKKIQSLVVYPKEALDSKIEGRVIVKILVAKNGDIVKKLVQYSMNELLNKSALNAFDKYGKVEPALQNNKPIHCWLSVPITFKVRPLEENKENE